MRRWQRILPLLLLSLLTLPALQPLFSQEFTCGFDNNFHLWRAVEISELLRDGVLYSRWAPHMAYGYGFPLFLFQAPLSATIAALFNLVGFDWPVAINATYGLSLLLSGWAMWLLARDLWSEKGGMVAAVAYVYAPFHSYVLFYRASMSESWAWVFAPLVLWGLRRWGLGRERWGLGTAVLALAAMMLSHDASTYAILPLFVGWIVIHLETGDWRLGTKARLQSLVSSLLPLFLGLTASAFFWLPAWLERHQVQFDRISSTWPFRYFDNFLPLNQLLSLPHNANPALLNDWPERGLGVLLLATAVLGFIAIFIERLRDWRLETGKPVCIQSPVSNLQSPKWNTAVFLTLALLGYSFLTLSPARFLWEAIPPMAAFTPWRFLAPATLAAALLSGAVASQWLTNERVLTGVTVAATVVLSFGHWGWLYPQHCPVPEETTAVGIVNFELATSTVGTTAKNELLPVTVQRLTKPEEGAPPVWQSRLLLPDDGQIVQSETELLREEIVVEMAAATTVHYRALYFSGWQVQIDGQTVPIAPSEPEGWLQFDVPDGRHTLTIQFRETPAWLVADGLSLLALLVTAVVMIRRGPRLRAEDRDCGQRAATAGRGELRATHYALFGLALILMGAKWLVDGQALWPHVVQNGGWERPFALTFGDPANPAQIRLLGYDDLPNDMPADEALELFLYWQALVPITADYRVGLTLIDENGLRWSEEGLRDYRWTRPPPTTLNWPTDQFALTAYLLDALPGTPPGTYTLQLALFERNTLVPLTIYDETGQVLGPTVDLGQITLTVPRQPWQDVAMQYELEDCCLAGSNIDRAEAAPGESVLVTLFVKGETAVSPSLNLLDENNIVAAAWPIAWPNLPDGLWRWQQVVQLPASLEDGMYRWQLGEVVWGELTIDAPERVLQPPTVAIPIDITLGEQATLVGATVTESESQVLVELVWRGERPISESYHVYLHLLAPDGTLLAQSDGIPAGNRPTPGWLPSEYITDVRVLPLPETDYHLRVGLYVRGGERLQTADGEDGVEIRP